MALETIGQELEDPFGTDANDLPLEFFEGACNAACKAMLPPMLSPAALESSQPAPAPAAAPSSPDAQAGLQALMSDPNFAAKVMPMTQKGAPGSSMVSRWPLCVLQNATPKPPKIIQK